MKRYLLFHGSDYYPGGGWDDFEGAYDTAEEARAKGNSLMEPTPGQSRWRWFHIVDTTTMQILQSGQT